MDRFLSLSAAVFAAGFLLFTACSKGPSPERELVEVTFSVQPDGEGTRTTANLAADEKKIIRWALLLYQEGKLIHCGTITPSGTIRQSLSPGDYEAYAIVNYPKSGPRKFRPDLMLDKTQLHAYVTDLQDNADYRFVMSGSRQITVVGHDGTQVLPVERLVCKTGIRKVTLSAEAPPLLRNAFVLKAIYLTNCLRSSGFRADPGPGDLPADLSQWAHPMQYRPEDDLDPLLADREIDKAVTPELPYTVPHYFYCYPNPTDVSEDTRAAQWAPRCTRMVLEAQVGSRTCYYSITLPSLKRNRTYIADEVVIRSYGSSDPEQVIPGSIEVVFSTGTQEWSPEFNIIEDS